VTKFVGRHGDHSCQHVAYDTGDLELFHAHMKQTGGMPRRETLIRNDGSDVAITFAE
jgi:cytolysin (calcineurin-like family phosphatase)